MLVTVCGADHTVRGHNLDLLEVVDRPAKAASQIAEAAAERQSGYSHVGNEPEHGRKAILLCRRIDVLQLTSGADARELHLVIHGDVAHARHVERQALSRHGRSGDVVSPSLHADQQFEMTREPNSRGDVTRREGLNNKRRRRSNHAVPYQNGVGPAVLTWLKQSAFDPRFEFGQERRRQVDASALEACKLNGGRGRHVTDTTADACRTHRGDHLFRV